MRVVELLLSNGALVESIDGQGSTALHVAAQHNRAPLIYLLLAAGAMTSTRDKHNRTAMRIAMSLGHTDVVHALKTAYGEFEQTQTKHSHKGVNLQV